VGRRTDEEANVRLLHFTDTFTIAECEVHVSINHEMFALYTERGLNAEYIGCPPEQLVR